MPESIQVEFGVLNIAAQPHPEGVYLNLLLRVANSARPFWGSEYAAITAPQLYEPGIYIGMILLWIEVDPDSPVVKKDSFQEISFRDSGISIPENLGLNSKHFIYVFRASDHKMFFEAKTDDGHSLAPSRLKKILDRLFSPINLKAELQIVVTVIPSEDGLTNVLNIPKITKLNIHIAPPNPDQDDEARERVLGRLVEQGARSQDTTLIAKSRKSGIKPNNETMLEAEVAAENGFVKAEGFDNAGTKLKRSTEEYPKLFPYTIDGAGSALAGLLTTAKTKLLNRKARKK